MITVVYAPFDNILKDAFWHELDTSRTISAYPWLICGDFNAVRCRQERS